MFICYTFSSYTFFICYTFLNALQIGVGGMNEGLQILLLGILFQRLHHNNTKFCTKAKFYHFWLLALEYSKILIFLPKNWLNIRYQETESKVKY